jgi:ribokinase
MNSAGGRLLVVGDLLTDVVVTGLDRVAADTDTPAAVELGGGGAAANTAAWAAALGTPTTFGGRVGDDPWGRAAADLLSAHGIELALGVDDELPTGTCVVLVRADGGRDLVVSPGASGALAAGDMPDPAGFAWVHLSGYPLLHEVSRPAAVGLLRAAQAAGVPCSVDPASVAPLRTLGAAAFGELVRGVDVLFPNSDEATELTGESDPVEAGRALLDLAAEVVVTLGADGALSVDRAGALVRVPAEVVDAIDTTGAGDAFAAGWLAARLTAADARARLEAGTACAAQVVTRLGTRPRDVPRPARPTNEWGIRYQV